VRGTASRARLAAGLAALALVGGCAWKPVVHDDGSTGRLDVIFVPSAPEVVDAMLAAAQVGPDDIVYDLGCGDGDILIAAAQRHRARVVGVDLDPVRIRRARLNAARAGVTDRAVFLEQDLFTTNVSLATVVALYLSPEVNARLRPKLLRELRPGTRIVSHDYGLGDWVPDRTIEVPLVRMHRVFLWRVPGGETPPR
jgi:SAM-dependent methyltransferase